MTRAHALYLKHSQDALVAMQSQVTEDPTNRNTAGGIHLYTVPARRKLADIAWAITHHLADKRAAADKAVPTNGYSGRNRNRR